MTVLFIDWMFLTSREHYFRCIHDKNKCIKDSFRYNMALGCVGFRIATEKNKNVDIEFSVHDAFLE